MANVQNNKDALFQTLLEYSLALDNKNKPLKLSSSGRLQIRKNLGPTGDTPRGQGNKKTIQIVFRNKNNQQKSSSTSQSNYRGSSSFRSSPSQVNTNFTPLNKN